VRACCAPALGPEIAAWLEDASVIEVMLNPDGRLWIDLLGAGIADTGSGMSAADGERIIRLVAHHVGAEVHAKAPRFRPSFPIRVSGSRASASGRGRAQSLRSVSLRRGVHARRLCCGEDHV